MISKFPRFGTKGCFDLKVTDKNNNFFIMTIGGNLDLFWLPDNHKENLTFVIDSKDKIGYSSFNQLYDAIEKVDESNVVLKDNKITFISEEWCEEESNKLQITKNKNDFVIEFIKNENRGAWTIPHRGCAICFCNSGSRVPKVEQLFMRMFNYLAYECDLIETEEICKEQ